MTIYNFLTCWEIYPSTTVIAKKLKRDLRKSQVLGYGSVLVTCGVLFVALCVWVLKVGEGGIWYRVPEYTNNFIVREGYANNITDTIKNIVNNNISRSKQHFDYYIVYCYLHVYCILLYQRILPNIVSTFFGRGRG